MSADFVAVTIGVGDEHRRLAEIAATKMCQYTGLDTVILGDDEYRRCGVRDPNHLKFRIFDLVDAENVLYFDGDLFCLRPWDPRQFVFSRLWVAVRGFWFDERVAGLGRKFGFRDETFNGGFFIINRIRHEPVLRLAEKIQPDDGLFDGFFSVDEMALSIALTRLHVPVHLIDRRYNWIQYGRGDLAADCDVVLAHACDAGLRSQFYASDDLPASGSAVPVMSGVARQLERQIGGRAWQYERVGYDQRLMEFRADGTIGAGGGNAERYWYVTHAADCRPRLVIGSVFDKSCVLDLRDDGTWRGHWLIGERMPIRLRPTPTGTAVPRDAEKSPEDNAQNGEANGVACEPIAEQESNVAEAISNFSTNGAAGASRAVVTACDEPYFPGLQVLARGLKGSPMLVFDLGLSERQREWCLQRGIELADPPPAVFPRTIQGWQSWNKPFYLEASPYELSLWIDCDCVVVGSIAPLFEHVESQPLIMRHWDEIYANGNKPELYERRPVLERFDSPRLLNAGVIGVRKSRDLDSPWFTCWARLICDAAGDVGLRKLIAFWDEGALIWALQAAGQTNLATIRPEWDRFMFSEPMRTPAQFWERVARPGDDVIWHFAGVNKVWDNWRIGDFLLEERSFEPYAPTLDAKPDFVREPTPERGVAQRHVDWMFNILITGRFEAALAIGTMPGNVGSAFVEALNRNRLRQAVMCGAEGHPSLARAIGRCREPARLRTVNKSPVEIVQNGVRYDFLFVNGDLRFLAAWEMLEHLLESPARGVMIHGANTATAATADRDGLAYLKWKLQTLTGYQWLEDSLPRGDEKTERGMFFATNDRELFELARDAFLRLCPATD